MNEFKTRVAVSPDGSVTIRGLPFPPGESVEVTVVPEAPAPLPPGVAPLHGSVLRYDDPTEPVATDDWESLR
jgi:hypothetical protein